MTVKFRQNQLAVSLQHQFFPTSIDLSEASSVEFRMTSRTGVVKRDWAACTITDTPNRKVRYDWQAGDLDTAGHYYGQYRITYNGGNTEIVPVGDPVEITVLSV